MHPGFKVLFQGIFIGMLMPTTLVLFVRAEIVTAAIFFVVMTLAFWFGLNNAERLTKRS